MRKKDKRRHERVKNPILKQAATSAKIKVRLDARTIITLKSMSALKLWKERYPNAVVITD